MPTAGGSLPLRTLGLLLTLAGTFPASAAHAQAPNTVLLEEMTWQEIRDAIARGSTSVIVGTAGTEQKGPHMVEGQHRYVLEYAVNEIARRLGNALVAPIVTYVPEGSWETRQGHMSKPGTITLPVDRFVVLLQHTARSLAAGGFKDILFLGDSGGNLDGMRQAAEALNREWRGSGRRAHFIGDYYTKADADQRAYLVSQGIPADQIGSHAGVQPTSEMMFVDRRHVRMDKLAPGSPESGVNGNPTLATAELGRQMIEIKVEDAVAQIRASLAAP